MRWLVVLGALSACLSPASPSCADGRVCARGTVCIAAIDVCVTHEQIAECAGLSDGALCAEGTCSNGACLSSEGCGNGVRDHGEVCDDGNTRAGDGCSADCKSDETCGNRVVDFAVGEDCDCGTAQTGLAAECTEVNGPIGLCNEHCKLHCGDGIVQPDEACDFNADTPTACAGVDDGSGSTFERGFTTCSPSCRPVDGAGCRYLGWRQRRVQNPILADVAITGPNGHGFVIAGGTAATMDAYVIGERFNAGAPLAAVWANDDTVAVAVGAGGAIARWNGESWTRQSGVAADLIDVWGRNGDDVFALSANAVVHWDSIRWSPVPIPAGTYRAISGDATRVVIAGDGGRVLVLENGVWRVVATGTTVDLHGVAVAAGRVVVVGDGGTILEDTGGGFVRGRTSTTANLRTVVGCARGFYAAGDANTVLAYDGRVWRALELGRGANPVVQSLFGLAVAPDGSGLVVLRQRDLLGYEGAAWSPTPQPTLATIDGLWASAPDDAYAVGAGGVILHHDGLAWTSEISPTTANLHAISGTAADDIYAVGDDHTLLHYDGNAWTLVHAGPIDTSDGDFTAVFALAPGELLVGGSSGLYQFDGTAFVKTTPVVVFAIWAASPDDAWEGGDGVLHWDGTAWRTSFDFKLTRGVSGTRADDVYAVGAESYRWNGTTFDPDPRLRGSGLTAVAATLDRGVFAVGEAGAFVHAGGTLGEPIVARVTTGLRAVWVSGKVVFMAGDAGVLDVLVFDE